MSADGSRFTRRRRSGQEEPQSPWLITYADMVTLLLVFFVLLFSFSEIDVQRFRTILSAFQASLGVLEGGVQVMWDDTAVQGTSEFDLEALDLVRPELAAQLRDVYFGLQAFVAGRGLEGAVQLELTERGVVVRFADRVLFDLGRAELKPEALEILAQVAEVLKDVPNPVRVEGHTDDLPIRTERFPSNWELSTARATNVIRHLIEEHGFDPRRLSAAGYGEYRPLVPNDSMENRALNRRVDIVLLRLDLEEFDEPLEPMDGVSEAGTD